MLLFLRVVLGRFDPGFEGLFIKFLGARRDAREDRGFETFQGNHAVRVARAPSATTLDAISCFSFSRAIWVKGMATARVLAAVAHGWSPQSEAAWFEVEEVDIAGLLVHGEEQVRLDRLG